MFRRLIMAIFRLYMKYLQLYKTYMGCYMGREGGKWALDIVFVREVGRCGLHEGPMLLPSCLNLL